MNDLGAAIRFDFNTDIAAINASIHRGLIRVWKDSVRAFLVAATDAMANNVDTGMSVASFQPLGAKVRLGTLIREISRGKGPKRRSKGDVPTGRFSNNAGTFRSRALGQRLGERAFTLEFGSPTNSAFEFTFTIVVLQHFLLENGLGKGSNIMYQSMKKGEAAFVTAFESAVPRIIDGDKIAEMFFENRIVEF